MLPRLARLARLAVVGLSAMETVTTELGCWLCGWRASAPVSGWNWTVDRWPLWSWEGRAPGVRLGLECLTSGDTGSAGVAYQCLCWRPQALTGISRPS